MNVALSPARVQHARAMTADTTPPPVHSQADPQGDDGRLSAPSAARNTGPIIEALSAHLPATGTVLEIAAGTGQHVVACARAFPGLIWQPSDIVPERLASIDAWRAAEGVGNMRVAIRLDAATPDWAFGPVELVMAVNLMHLIPEAAARNVIRGVSRALAPGGRFFLYGPFRTGGGFRSEGDARFDASLRREDAAIGYKDAEWIGAETGAAGLEAVETVEMPANNLSLVFVKR